MADTYQVTGQQEALDVDDVTNPVRIMLVTFKALPSGVTGSVRVPIKDYSPETVHAAITKYVDNINAVHEL